MQGWEAFLGSAGGGGISDLKKPQQCEKDAYVNSAPHKAGHPICPTTIA